MPNHIGAGNGSKENPPALSDEDIRAVIRLLGQTTAVPGDINVKRRFLLDGLSSLVGATWWGWSQVTGIYSKQGPVASAFLLTEMPREQLDALAKCAFDTKSPLAEYGGLAKLPFRHSTRTRQDLVGDDELFQTKSWNQFRAKAKLGETIYSVYPLSPPDNWSMLGICRDVGLPAFTARDRYIVHLVTSEVDWLHREGFEAAEMVPMRALSPRLREAFFFLMMGDSAKQVAGKMKLSEHTVRDHIKELYKRFGVSSRGELHSFFYRGG